jgi:hypothetical protein
VCLCVCMYVCTRSHFGSRRLRIQSIGAFPGSGGRESRGLKSVSRTLQVVRCPSQHSALARFQPWHPSMATDAEAARGRGATGPQRRRASAARTEAALRSRDVPSRTQAAVRTAVSRIRTAAATIRRIRAPASSAGLIGSATTAAAWRTGLATRCATAVVHPGSSRRFRAAHPC